MIRRKNRGTGRMQYEKDMPRRFKNGFREKVRLRPLAHLRHAAAMPLVRRRELPLGAAAALTATAGDGGGVLERYAIRRVEHVRNCGRVRRGQGWDAHCRRWWLARSTLDSASALPVGLLRIIVAHPVAVWCACSCAHRRRRPARRRLPHKRARTPRRALRRPAGDGRRSFAGRVSASVCNAVRLLCLTRGGVGGEQQPRGRGRGDGRDLIVRMRRLPRTDVPRGKLCSAGH